MAIKKKFSVSGKTSGDIAFQTGRGQRRERDLVRAQAAAEETRRVQLAENARQEALALRRSETKQAREDADIRRQDRIAEAESGREFTLERDVFARAGKIDDLEFGRESTSIAGREAEEQRAREFALAAKHKADGDERQYTIEQQRKLEAINSSRVKIQEGLANGTITDFQAKQFEQELISQQLNITKVWGPKQVTRQDQLKADTFTADNGTLMYIDGAGKVQAYPGQLTPQEKLEAAEKKETQEYDWEVKRQEAEFDVQSKKADMIEKFMSSEVNEKSFEQVSEMVDKMFAAPVQPQTEQEITAELNELIRIGASEGKSATEVIDLYEAATGKPQPQERTQAEAAAQAQVLASKPGANYEQFRSLSFDEHSPEVQAGIAEFGEIREKNRQSGGRNLLGEDAQGFGAQSPEQFVQEFNSNDELKRTVMTQVVREEVLKMTSADWEEAFANYTASNAGKRIKYSTKTKFKSHMGKRGNQAELLDYFQLGSKKKVKKGFNGVLADAQFNIVSDPTLGNKGSGAVEFLGPLEPLNPTPGKPTIAILDEDKFAANFGEGGREAAILGEKLHYLKEIDSKFAGMREQFRKSMTPNQLKVDQRVYDENVASGRENRSFEDWMEASRLDAYIRGYVAPDKNDEWRKQGAYNDSQKKLLNDIKRYVTKLNRSGRK
jgi:hypothetical protein